MNAIDWNVPTADRKIPSSLAALERHAPTAIVRRGRAAQETSGSRFFAGFTGILVGAAFIVGLQVFRPNALPRIEVGPTRVAQAVLVPTEAPPPSPTAPAVTPPPYSPTGGVFGASVPQVAPEPVPAPEKTDAKPSVSRHKRRR